MPTWSTEGNFSSIQLHLLCWYCKISYISDYYTTTSYSTRNILAQDQKNPASVDFLLAISVFLTTVMHKYVLHK